MSRRQDEEEDYEEVFGDLSPLTSPSHPPTSAPPNLWQIPAMLLQPEDPFLEPDATPSLSASLLPQLEAPREPVFPIGTMPLQEEDKEFQDLDATPSLSASLLPQLEAPHETVFPIGMMPDGFPSPPQVSYPPPPQIPLTPPTNLYFQAPDESNAENILNHPLIHHPVPRRRRPILSRRRNELLKDDPIIPPYDWATERRAEVRPIADIRASNITSISGTVVCSVCGSFEHAVELARLEDLRAFVQYNMDSMFMRAPRRWMEQNGFDCLRCRERGEHALAKPIVADKKKHINWLFLLMTETIGLCDMKQLRYLLKHRKIHRSGAKDRLVFSVYVELLRQVFPDPNGPFNLYE